MTTPTRRRTVACAMIAASGFIVTGCVSSPTYGTDKTATEQLVGDVTGILSVGPKNKQPIDYKPRPELVKPTRGQVESLPAPQQAVATAENPNWPESPEQRRARIRANASVNRDKPGFEAEVENDMPVSVASNATSTGSSRFADSGLQPVGAPTLAQQGDQVKKRLAETQQGSDAKRKYLSEPPLVYRQPADTAPVGVLGEDEVKKERRLKRAARKGSSWADLWPF